MNENGRVRGQYMRKKKIWLMNHYATGMFFNKGGRHYWFAENLISHGYEPTVFCANTRHNSGDVVETGTKKFIVKITNDIPFLFVKTSPYSDNGLNRIKNILLFYRNLFPAAKAYAKLDGRPDIILASSVHPLTLVAGIKIARKFGVPCICEIRDLWPESFVAYNIIRKNNPILKLLYAGEKWIYKKADKLIFTMEGGKDYIIEKGWDKDHGGPIDINKVYHINNGVDLETFDYNKEHYILDDEDLQDENTFKVVYTGSIRKANSLELVVNVAKYIQKKYNSKFKFLLWGEGNEKKYLEEKCKKENIKNVFLKGNTDKKYIPYIVNKANLNILNYSYHKIWKYGGSQNKLFEYLAAGKPVLSTIKMGYGILEKYNAGISLRDQGIEDIANNIINISEMPAEKYNLMCTNARRAAQDYDFALLSDRLISFIET